jgi:hypothetical protein
MRKAIADAHSQRPIDEFNVNLSRLAAIVRGRRTNPQSLCAATDLLLVGGSLAEVETSSSSSSEEEEAEARSPSVRVRSRSPSLADFAGNTPSPSAEPAVLPRLSDREASATVLRALPCPSSSSASTSTISTGA